MADNTQPPAKTTVLENRWLCRAFIAAWSLLMLLSVLRPYLHSLAQTWMEYQEDDFYYYLKVAASLAHGHGSTFNGIVPTNGYHPLWLLTLTAVLRLADSWQAIFAFVTLAILVATAATFLLAERLLRAANAPRLVRLAMAAYIATFAMHLYDSGMEVILALPLLFGVAVLLEREDLWRRSLLHSIALGLLLAATILSRLDTGLLAAMLLFGLVALPSLRRKLTASQIAGIAIGLLPVALYLACNHLWFHTWLPISGMAKQLKPIGLPTSPAWKSVFGKQPLQVLNFVIPLLGLLPLAALWSKLAPIRRLLYSALLLFPYLYLLMISSVSDWSLWAWYLYAFWPAVCVTFVLYATWRPTVRLLRLTPIAALFCAVVLLEGWTGKRIIGGMAAMHHVGQEVAAFAATHPGTYAMGDRSGIVGYLLPAPLVQTEGLMMDRAFLTRVARQEPLREALAAYNVRYYIASTYDEDVRKDGCLHVGEPYQAGPHSPQMHATFCEQPLATFHNDPATTLIYDLHPADASGSTKPR